METSTIRIEFPLWVVEKIDELIKEGWTINLDAICTDAVTDVISSHNRTEILKIQDDLAAMGAKLAYLRFGTEKDGD